MNIRFKTLGASILATSMIAAIPALADSHANPMVGGAEMFPDRNIVENAVNSADHTTLVAAVQAADLVDTLSGEGPFTVFAPVNTAFEALPEGTVDTLLQPENLEQLQTILTCHVVAGEVPASAVVELIEAGDGEAAIETVGGCTLTASAGEDGSVIITDENGNAATVTQADVGQSNGVIHVIDTVLLPAS